jgi:hypothetical protein
MDAGSAVNADDPADVELREGRALQLILSGVKKKDAFKQCKLPYKSGDKEYRRICRLAGKRNNCLYYFNVIL